MMKIENHLKLYPNGSLLFDPTYIGKISWPNDPYLPAKVNRELTIFLMDMIARADMQPHNQVLRSLYSLPGILAFNLSYYRLYQEAITSELAGFSSHENLPHITVDINILKKTQAADLKDFLAVYGQRLLLSLGHLLRHNLKISVSAAPYYPQEKFGKIYRLRRADAIPRVLGSPLSEDEKEKLSYISAEICKKYESICTAYACRFDNQTWHLITAYIQATVERAWQECEAYKSFFKNMPFSYFERSLTPYQNALMAVACHSSGGVVHSTYHGVCQSANEPDITTMANAHIFWAPTEAFAQDAHDLSAFIPNSLRTYQIKTYDDSDHHKRFLRQDSPRQNIRTIAIIGRHIVMRYSAFNMLEFPFYLDLEKKLGDLLLAHGYEVIYKAHPESDWRCFDQYFDSRIKIDWRPYEKVMDEFDAVIYHFAASSTLPPALGSHQHIFMIEDGWHDQKIWPPRIVKYFKEYANILPAAIGADGLIMWDEEAILDIIKHPKAVNPEQRIFDFFNKTY